MPDKPWDFSGGLTNRHLADNLVLAWPAPNLLDLPQHGLERRQRDFCLGSLVLCQSAWNVGSDSLLMNSGRQLALVLQKESAPWFIRFAPLHSCLEALSSMRQLLLVTR